MAGFNLTAEINLRGPSNIKKVVGDIKRQLSGIQTNVDLKISDKASRSLETITGSVNALNAALTKAQVSANSLTSVLSSVGSAGGNTAQNLNSVSQSVTQVVSSTASASKSIAQASSEMAEFGKQSALAVRRFAAFSVATGAIYGLTRAFTSAYSEFVQFDKELVRLKQTVGGFGQDIDSIGSEISRLSTTFGVSSSDLLKVSVTLAQAGLSARETKNALEALAKTTLSPSFEDITQTTEGAIAALRQFGLSTKDLESSLGSINAVAAAFAVESSDIISAIQRTGGVFANASKGVTQGKDALNEFIAVFTSVRQTTRESAETIATGLRTIFTRIQRGSTIEALREYGVELTDLKGKFVGPYEAVRRLSEGLSKLDPRDIRFSKIVEELGGFRQIGKVIPLIQQFSVAQEALGIAQQGQASLTTNAIQAQQALAVQFSKTREEFLSFVRALGQSDTFQNLVSYGLSFTRVLIQIASAFKPLMPYLATLGALKGGAALTEYVGGFVGGLKRGGGSKTSAPQEDLLGSLFSSAKEKSSADSSTTGRLETLIGENNTALSNVNNALVTLNRTLSSKTGGTPASGPSLGFASGGFVPGSGNRDTVPAMLTPGEFVIRKKAVETLGAGNLQRMNKYASGGKVKKFAWGGKVSELAEIYPSIENAVGYEEVANKRIRDDSKFQAITPTKKQIKQFQDMEGPYGARFEAILSSDSEIAKPIKGAPKPSKWDYLDFPAARGEAKFMAKGDTYDDGEGKGNTDLTIAAKNYLFENSLRSPNRPNLRVDELWPDITNPPPATVYYPANPADFLKKSFGGIIQKFMPGGKVDALSGVESTLLSRFDIEKLEPTNSNDVEELISLIELMGGNEKTRNLANIQSVNIGGRQIRSGDILSANKLRASKYAAYIPYARDIVNAAIEKYNSNLESQAGFQQAMLSANQFQMATLLPFDANKTIQAMIGGRATSIIAKGIPSTNIDIIQELQSKLSGATSEAAEKIQMRKIFGSKPLVFDFDETLIENLSNLMEFPNGGINTELFNDLPRVEKALESIKLTRLGEVLKAKLDNQEISPNDLRIVSARPQSNAPYMAKALARLGLNIPESRITGTTGAENKIHNVSEFETLIDDRLATVEQFQKAGKKAIGYAPIVSDFSGIKAVFAGQASMEGAAAEKILANLGAPLRADAEPGRPIDYPQGLGLSAQYWDLDPNIPTEVKRELNSSAITRTKAEILRFYNKNAEGYKVGGEVKQSDIYLQRYKQLIASILPKEMISDEGLLKTPSGRSEPIDIVPPEDLGEKSKRSMIDILLGRAPSMPQREGGASYSGGLIYKLIRKNLYEAKDNIPEKEFQALKNFVDQNLLFEGEDDIINLEKQKRRGSLAHESFHDIQGYLLDYYPQVYQKLQQSVNDQRKNIEAWYSDPDTKQWRGPRDYTLEHIYPQKASDSPYAYTTMAMTSGMEKANKGNALTPFAMQLVGKTVMDLGRAEAIPVLMAAAAEGNGSAQQILSNIFGSAGLNKDFYKFMPKFADGGVATQSKKLKEYGKIALRDTGASISATYFKNDQRQGSASAYKFRDYLYYVGLSAATSGYGPRLYDVLMEAATANGAMLTSDRSAVSGDAKRVWDYYFNNRGDVKKTPLKPEDWTKNQSLIDPKLYGKPETWPPSTDPAWVLQSGYSKTPELIKDPTAVKINKKAMGGLIQRLAAGGNVESLSDRRKKLPSVNQVGAEMADQLKLVKGPNAYNQADNNCLEIAMNLAKKFGYEADPEKFRAQLKLFEEVRASQNMGYGMQLTPEVLKKNSTLRRLAKDPTSSRTEASLLVREGDQLMRHVSLEVLGKEYNYGAAGKDWPIILRVPVKKKEETAKDAIKKFAKGGSAEDTVPALLTPGEFVINKKAAQKIGYSKLHKLNKADKLQGFNKGGLVGFAAGGKAAPGNYAAEVDNFVAQLVKLTQTIEETTYKMERAAGKSVPEAKKQADTMAQLGVIDAGRATVYLNPESAQAVGDAVGKVLESYVSKLNPLIEGGPRKTGYATSGGGTSGFAGFIENTTPKQDTIEKWKLLAAAAGESLDIFSDRVKRFTVDLAVNYKNLISRTQTRAKAAVALASNQPGNESNRGTAVELLKGLLINYQPSATDKGKFTPEAIERTLNNAAKLMEQGLSFDEVKKSSDLLQIAFDDVIENSEALAVALSEAEKRFGPLTEKQTASETLMRGIESGRWSGSLSRIESMQASSEANPFWEKIAGNKFPGFDYLNKVAPETAQLLGKITEKLGGFIGVLSSGAAILGNSLPKVYEGFDRLAGTSFKNSEVAQGFGKALNQAGNDALGMAKFAQQAEFGAKGTGIAAGVGLTLGAVKGFAEGFITQKLENTNTKIADSQERIANLLSQLSTPGLEPAAQEDIKANALKEIQTLSNELGTVLKNTESYWSTSIYNLADAALFAAQTFLTVASTLALIRLGSGLTGSTGGYVGYYSNGDLVKNKPMFQPKGTDTVPAMLTPGEFVVNAGATKRNRGLLEDINSGRYMARGGVVYAAKGGMFGDWTRIQSDQEAGRSRNSYSGTFSDFYNPWDKDFYESSKDATEAVLKFTGRLSMLVGTIAAAAAAVMSFGPAVGGFFTKTLPGLFTSGFAKVSTVATGAWGKIAGIFGASKAAAVTTAAGVPVVAPQAAAAGGGIMGTLATGAKLAFGITALTSTISFLYRWLSGSGQNKEQQQNLVLQGQIIDKLIEYAKVSEVKNIPLEELKRILLEAKGKTGQARNTYFAERSPVVSAAQRAQLQSSGFGIGEKQSIDDFISGLDAANQEQARVIVDSVKLEQIRKSIVADEAKKASLAGKSQEEAAAQIKRVVAPLENFKTFSEAQKQGTNDPAVRALIERAQTLQGPTSERIYAEETFGSMASKMNAQVDMVVIALKNFEQGINRVGDLMSNLQNTLPTALGNRLGNDNPSIRLDRSDLAILKNISASSNEQIAQAVATGGAQMGMTAEGTRYFTQQFKVQKVLETELPLILSRIVAEGKTGGESGGITASEKLQTELEAAISRVVPNKDTAKIITTGIVSKLNADNRGQGGYERFIQDPALLASVTKQQNSSTSSFIRNLETLKTSIENLTQISDTYANVLNKVAELQSNYAKISAESSINLKKALGEEVSLPELNKVFEDEIKAMTQGTTGVGTSDPREIGKRLAGLETERQSILDELEMKGGSDLRTRVERGMTQPQFLEPQFAGLGKRLGSVTSESDRLKNALQTLASNSQNAANVLAKIQELRRIDQAKESNFMDFLKNINNPEYIVELQQTARALSAVMSGQGTRWDIPGAIKGLEMRISQMSPEDAAKERAAFLDQILKIEPALAQLFGPGGAFEGAFKTKNPQIDALQKQYDELVAKQLAAVSELQKRAIEGGNIVLDRMKQGAELWYSAVMETAKFEATVRQQNIDRAKEAESERKRQEERRALGLPPLGAPSGGAALPAPAGDTSSVARGVSQQLALSDILIDPSKPMRPIPVDIVDISDPTLGRANPIANVNASTGGKIVYAADGQYINFQPKGTDTVPAMLTPGEFVVNKKATQKNLGLLKSINSGYYANGGLVYRANGSVEPETMSLRQKKTRIPTLEEWMKLSLIERQNIINQLGRNPYPMANMFSTTISGGTSRVSVDNTRLNRDLASQTPTATAAEQETLLKRMAESQSRENRAKQTFNNLFDSKLWGEYFEEEFNGIITPPDPAIEKRKRDKLLKAGTGWNKGEFATKIGQEVGDLMSYAFDTPELGVITEAAFGLADPAFMAATISTAGLGTGAAAMVEGGTFATAGGVAYSQGDYQGAQEAAMMAAFTMGTHFAIRGAEKVMSNVATSRAISEQALRREAVTGQINAIGEEIAKLESKGITETAGTSKGLRLSLLKNKIEELKAIEFNETDIATAAATYAKKYGNNPGTGIQGSPTNWADMPGATPRSTRGGGFGATGEDIKLGDLKRPGKGSLTMDGVYVMPTLNKQQIEEAARGGIGYGIQGYRSTGEARLVTMYTAESIKPEQIIDIFDTSGSNQAFNSIANEFAYKAGYTAKPGETLREILNNSILAARDSGVTDDALSRHLNNLYRKYDIKMVTGANEFLEGATGRGLGGAIVGDQPISVKSDSLWKLSLPSIKVAIEDAKKEAAAKISALASEFVSRQFETHETQEVQNKASGGLIYASNGSYINFKPKGTDTVPAMLTPGEFVVNRKATQNNLPLLQSINNGYYNKGGKVKYLADGGLSGNGDMAITNGVSSISIDTSSLDSAFKAFGDHVGSMKQSLDSFSASISGLANLGEGARVLSVAAASIRNASDNFSNNITLFNSALSTLERSINNIPSTISLQVTGSIPVNVNVQINGGKDLDNSLQPFKDTIYSEITKAISDATQGNININLFTTKR